MTWHTHYIKGRAPWNKGGSHPSIKGENNPAKRPEVRQKISENNSMKRPEVRARFSGERSPAKRPEVRAKISSTKKGKPCPWMRARMMGDGNPAKRPEIRIKLSGANHPMKRPEIRAKVSEARMQPSLNARISEEKRGERNPSWKGGISFEPYCPKFNEEFKERVRAFFGYRCVRCGKTQEENGGRLHVHHVNYKKEACCDEGIPKYFATLCNSDHSRSNHNREKWQKELIEIIEEKYGGKCYFSQGEQLASCEAEGSG